MQFVELPSGIVVTEAAFAEKLHKKPDLNEVATSLDGRDVTRGFIPQSMLMSAGDTILTGKGAGSYEIYEEIARDDQLITCRNQRNLALIAKEWEVKPGDDSRRARKAADRLKSVLERIQWDDKTQKMLSAILYGYAVAEIMWATDGNEITIESIKVRNRSRFGFLPSGELRMKTSQQSMSGETLPPGKFWAFACGADHDDEPYGLGLGHYLYWPVFFKRNGIKFWLYFLEKFGQPTALGKYPTNATLPEKNKLLEALRAIHTDSAIRIPEGMQVELLEAARSGTADYTALIDRMNAAISKIYLGHSGAADSTPGRLGGEDNALTVRDDFIKADADLICGSFNQSVARWLTHYNDPGAPPPCVWRSVDPEEDLKARADRDKVLFDMGYKPKLTYIHDSYDGEYEEIEKHDNELPNANQEDNQETRGREKPTEFAEPEKKSYTDDHITQQLTQEAAPGTNSLVDAIRQKVNSAQSLEALQDDLLASFAELDHSELVKIMELAFLSAELSGLYDVSEGG